MRWTMFSVPLWSSPRRRLDLVGCGLLVALALAAVVVADRGALLATRSGLRLVDPSVPAPEHTFEARFQSVRRQLGAQVPRGSRVLLRRVPLLSWRHWFAEAAMTQGIMVVNPTGRPDFAVDLVASAQTTGGLRVVVHSVAGTAG
jgi:hypothetical protein